ncbi:MAG: hypothetical protein HQM09_08890 [Candidatus Riflebacteria bacterium]|nr:hypothetical protein [Candidatus Riflebacteria bacterium]
MDMVPSGCGLPADVLANTLQSIFLSPGLMMNSHPGIVNTLRTIIQPLFDTTGKLLTGVDPTSISNQTLDSFVRRTLPATIPHLEIASDGVTLLALANQTETWRRSPGQVLAYTGSGLTDAANWKIQRLFCNGVDGFAYVGYTDAMGARSALARIDLTTASTTGICLNQGPLNQGIVLPDTSVVLGGVEGVGKTPILARWSGAGAVDTAVGTGFFWSPRKFSEISLTNTAIGVSGIQFDGNDTLIVAFPGTVAGMVRTYRIAIATGLGGPQFTGAIVNSPPLITIVQPAPGAIFPVGMQIPIEAQARDLDGTIANMQILKDGQLVASSTTAACTYSFTPTTAGSYTFQVSAWDNLGASTTWQLPVIVAPASTTVRSLLGISLATHTILLTSATGTFDLATIGVNASYSDLTIASVTRVEWSLASGSGSLVGTIFQASGTGALLACTYSEGGLRRVDTLGITIPGLPAPRTLVGISLATNTVILLSATGTFDLATIGVVASYSNQTIASVTNVNWNLASGSGAIVGTVFQASGTAAILTCSYSESSITRIATLSVAVPSLPNSGAMRTIAAGGNWNASATWVYGRSPPPVTPSRSTARSPSPRMLAAQPPPSTPLPLCVATPLWRSPEVW